MLQIGEPAPDFTLESDKAGTISLQDLQGQQVVLYFYPKDDTPGCTIESCDFRDHYTTFQDKNIHVFGISCDDIDSHQRFTDKYSLPFPLLSDPDTTVSTAYGVYKERTRDGKTFMGIERTTFIIDGEGNISHIYPQVNVDGHVDEVLTAVD